MKRNKGTKFYLLVFFIISTMNGFCEKLPSSIFYYVKQGTNHTLIKIEEKKYYHYTFKSNTSHSKINVKKLLEGISKEDGIVMDKIDNMKILSVITDFADKNLKLNETNGLLIEEGDEHNFHNRSIHLNIIFLDRSYTLDGWDLELFEIFKAFSKQTELKAEGNTP